MGRPNTMLTMQMWMLLLAAFVFLTEACWSTDCNRNGIDDVEDLIAPLDFEAKHYPVDNSPGDFHDSDALIAVELNADERPDLVFATSSYPDENGVVSVIINRGDGSFGNSKKYYVGTKTTSVSIADFNNDHAIDLASVDTGSDSVSVLINYGDGTFSDAVRYMVGREPQGVAIDDFNNDGFPDIATADHGSGSVTVLLNRGDGSFKVTPEDNIGEFPQFVIATDVNDDDVTDLAIASAVVGDITILQNQGDGTFAQSDEYLLGARLTNSFVAADLNADDVPDLASTYWSSDESVLEVLLSQGDGRFEPVRVEDRGAAFGELMADDFNGDNNVDLVTTIGGRGPAVWINGGGGAFARAAEYESLLSQSPLRAADLDGDNKLDLAAVTSVDFGNYFVSIFRNERDGTFAKEVRLNIGKYPKAFPEALVATDVNADGKSDLVIAGTGSDDVWVLINLTAMPVSMDLNRNNVPDECDANAFRRGDSNVDARLNITDAVIVLEFLFRGGGVPTCMDAADSNGDGTLDLTDGIFLLTFLFLAGDSPRTPGPPPGPCGMAPPDTPRLGCAIYAQCP